MVIFFNKPAKSSIRSVSEKALITMRQGGIYFKTERFRYIFYWWNEMRQPAITIYKLTSVASHYEVHVGAI